MFMLADLFSSGRCGSVSMDSLLDFEELFVALYMAAGFFSTKLMVLGRQWWKLMDRLVEGGVTCTLL